MPKTSDFYHDNAEAFYERYRSLTTEDVLGEAIGCVPIDPSLVLDIGSGSGRDSDWLAGFGHVVISVEPAAALRELAIERCLPGVVHYDTCLPHLEGLERFVGKFEFILCSAVWMHLQPHERIAAAARIHDLLVPGASAIVTYKVAPADIERLMYPLDPDQVVAEFEATGFSSVVTNENADQLDRADTRWFTSVLTK